MATINEGFSDFEDDDISKANKEIIKDANLKSTNNKNRGGRKPKEVKADKTIRVYITDIQKKLIEDYCLKIGTSESTLIKQLLIKEGIL